MTLTIKKSSTAAERLKVFSPALANQIEIAPLFRQCLEDKGFDFQSVKQLASTGAFASLFIQGFLNLHPRRVDFSIEGLNFLIHSLESIKKPQSISRYRGLPEQNLAIDRALAACGVRVNDHLFGEGAATFFDMQVKKGISDRVQDVPIAIIGFGAAGIIANFALRAQGFRNITVYEKSDTLGIWSQSNVHQLSRNNPRDISFYDRVLRKAPGDGYEVREFLDNLASHFRGHREKAKVKEVVPGNLNHKLCFAKNQDPVSFPIVINTMGIGKPKPLSDSRRMTTDTVSGNEVRWQQELEVQDCEGKNFVFIGLGNSTAEMLSQIHDFQDDGVAVDYVVLTHYPEESVQNPDSQINSEGQRFRVFRDLSLPNLVDYQGDLPDSRSDYYRALYSGRIISGVKHWTRQNGHIKVFGKNRKEPIGIFPCDKLWALIGYRNSQEVMQEMGIYYDKKNQCGRFDYDGEVIADPRHRNPASRLHKGYYGFGSILESPFNQNAIVIPGMLHRIGDLVFSVALRAAEYAYS